MPNPTTLEPAARPIAHTAVINADQNLRGGIRYHLSVYGEDGTGTETLVFYTDLDDIPTEHAPAIAEANKILPRIGWTRTHEWFATPGGLLIAELRPRYGLLTVQLVACSRNEPMPGMILGGDRIPEIPGLDDHPDVYAWKVDTGVLTDSSLRINVLPADVVITGYPTLHVTLPLLEPMHDSTHFTVDMLDPDRAQALAQLLADRGRPAQVEGTHVALTRPAVDALATIAFNSNGHFDHSYVRWDGVSYPLELVSVEDLLARTAA